MNDSSSQSTFDRSMSEVVILRSLVQIYLIFERRRGIKSLKYSGKYYHARIRSIAEHPSRTDPDRVSCR